MPLAQHCQHIVVRVTVMNDDGQVKLRRQLKLLPERTPLGITRRKVTIIIQADLADGHILGRVRQRFQFGKTSRIERSSFMRMNTDGGVNALMPLSQPDCSMTRGQVHTWIDDVSNAAFDCPLYGGFSIYVELRLIEMTMGINHAYTGKRQH